MKRLAITKAMHVILLSFTEPQGRILPTDAWHANKQLNSAKWPVTTGHWHGLQLNVTAWLLRINPRFINTVAVEVTDDRFIELAAELERFVRCR